MEFSVSITLQAARPVGQRQRMALAEMGGAVDGNIGSRHVATTLTVTARDIPDAAKRGIELVTSVVAGTLVAIEILTTEEADRRLALPPPQYAGMSEVAEMLGVSKERVRVLRQRQDFPAPIADLASGPVWRAGDLSRFSEGWRRQPGRPRKAVTSADRLVDIQTGK